MVPTLGVTVPTVCRRLLFMAIHSNYYYTIIFEIFCKNFKLLTHSLSVIIFRCQTATWYNKLLKEMPLDSNECTLASSDAIEEHSITKVKQPRTRKSKKTKVLSHECMILYCNLRTVEYCVCCMYDILSLTLYPEFQNCLS